MSVIALKNINKSYGSRMILSDASFNVDHGDLVGIIGRSGSGKTTLLNILGFMDIADSGEYFFDSQLIKPKDEKRMTVLRRDEIGFIVQDYGLIKERSVFYNIALPLLSQNTPKKEIKHRVDSIAEQLKISDLINEYPHEISGGEAQRVAIARALIRKPKIILADEPTGALDESAESDILEILHALNRSGVTIAMVTHNQVVANICKKLYTIVDGKIVPV
ncbi:putative ABC transport system ATP-binding protein [Paenibacillus jamilae]|uniref:ABC transporter ATP-binding protein n=1 Tax=Paenibacillus ottowii TaxID=2315729 RepID=UPI0011B12CC0|nr:MULTISPECIES: ABC transporter ATP-binding protein [Paenibacillus]MDP1508791.1 ABC transporter ATP-binding protein [Paenibacillus ottowii]MDP9676958.1 putative ABC transport system ATP-binding protein [Paenibacillus jamilae]MEC4565085.1 ABC transporter ATP-binding protein [Paenibacillus sp. CMAA1739]QDY83098.1 ABC transporter ATP-binding protein [Paenibacillus polymyxa]